MNPKLTDDAVAGLPLHQGRAELLEEIMRTPVLDDRPVRAEQVRRRTGWVVPVVAAAAIAALVAGSAALLSGLNGGVSGDRNTPAAAGAPRAAGSGPPARGDHRAVLDAPGWTVDGAYADAVSGEVTYTSGNRFFTITWDPAATYDDYVLDRSRDVPGPPADGEAIEVLGRDAQLWAYAKDDHTAIRAVDGGSWMELRGKGMDEAAYLELLGQLRLVDRAGFEAAMPDSFVETSERAGTVDDMVAGIAEHLDPLLPPGTPESSVQSDQTDPYQLGAEVAGGVACAWLGEFEDASRAGDQQRMDAAAEALGTARDWPVLQGLAARGEYADILWSYADEVVAGQVPEGYAGGLGC